MPRESKVALRRRAEKVTALLFREHADAHCELMHENAFQLLCATILSAQSTDKRVNVVTPVLFAEFPDAKTLAKADRTEVESIIRTTGFYRNKAKALVGMANAVMDRHGGEIPSTMEELVELPGVGRKTANVILGNIFDVPALVVDTHVGRIAAKLKLTTHSDAVRIERDLMEVIPEDRWTMFSHVLIFYGRRICIARRPRCSECVVQKLCPSAELGV